MTDTRVEVLCYLCKQDYLVPYTPETLQRVGEQYGMCPKCQRDTPPDYDD